MGRLINLTQITESVSDRGKRYNFNLDLYPETNTDCQTKQNKTKKVIGSLLKSKLLNWTFNFIYKMNTTYSSQVIALFATASLSAIRTHVSKTGA